jgi:hypothetical protein
MATTHDLHHLVVALRMDDACGISDEVRRVTCGKSET